MLSPSVCTTSFVFQTTPGPFDPAQQLYVGTAGHCAGVGQSVVVVAGCPGGAPEVLLDIGTVVVSNIGEGNDFALIAIHPYLNGCVSPSMAHWGGPTGTYRSDAEIPVVHSGHGTGLGAGGTPRAGLLRRSTATEHGWLGAADPGDSGSGVNTATGLAIANLTHSYFPGQQGNTVPHDLAIVGGTRIERILEIAGRPLSTCPAAVPWPLPGCPPA